MPFFWLRFLVFKVLIALPQTLKFFCSSYWWEAEPSCEISEAQNLWNWTLPTTTTIIFKSLMDRKTTGRQRSWRHVQKISSWLSHSLMPFSLKSFSCQLLFFSCLQTVSINDEQLYCKVFTCCLATATDSNLINCERERGKTWGVFSQMGPLCSLQTTMW